MLCHADWMQLNNVSSEAHNLSFCWACCVHSKPMHWDDTQWHWRKEVSSSGFPIRNPWDRILPNIFIALNESNDKLTFYTQSLRILICEWWMPVTESMHTKLDASLYIRCTSLHQPRGRAVDKCEVSSQARNCSLSSVFCAARLLLILINTPLTVLNFL